MKNIQNFIAHFPITSFGLTCFIVGLLAGSTTLTLIDHRIDWTTEALIAAMIAVALFTAHYVGKRIVALLLCASLLFSPPQMKAVPALCLGAAIVLIIGGIAGCRIIKKGGNIAKNRTNAWPDELHVAADGHYECGASFTWISTDCYEARTLPADPVVFTMHIFVESTTNCVTTIAAQRGEQFVESLDACKEDAASHGLVIPSVPQPSASYERNRQPTFAEAVPIRFDFDSHTLTLGDGGVLLSVEGSDDLETWDTVMNFNVEVGARLEIPDVSYGKKFYQVVIR